VHALEGVVAQAPWAEQLADTLGAACKHKEVIQVHSICDIEIPDKEGPQKALGHGAFTFAQPPLHNGGLGAGWSLTGDGAGFTCEAGEGGLIVED
jgi:hypothetical protein